MHSFKNAITFESPPSRCIMVNVTSFTSTQSSSYIYTLPCLPIILSCLTDSHISLYLNSLLNSTNSLCPLSHHLPLAPPSITPCHSERISTLRKILSRSIYSTTTLIPLIVKAPAVLRCVVPCQWHFLFNCFLCT